MIDSSNRGIKQGNSVVSQLQPRYAFVSQETYHIHLSSIAMVYCDVLLYEYWIQADSKN
jgi:hypothetical protein